jgi:hypothetical protein
VPADTELPGRSTPQFKSISRRSDSGSVQENLTGNSAAARLSVRFAQFLRQPAHRAITNRSQFQRTAVEFDGSFESKDLLSGSSREFVVFPGLTDVTCGVEVKRQRLGIRVAGRFQYICEPPMHVPARVLGKPIDDAFPDTVVKDCDLVVPARPETSQKQPRVQLVQQATIDRSPQRSLTRQIKSNRMPGRRNGFDKPASSFGHLLHAMPQDVVQ